MPPLLLAAFLGASGAAPASAPRLDFIDEICFYQWTEDRWACDSLRLSRVAVEEVEVEPGPAPFEVRLHRHAVDEQGVPTLLPPEERGYDPQHWGPKPLWVCVSGAEVTPGPGVEPAWDRAEWTVDGRAVPTVSRDAVTHGATLVQGREPPCVGPRLFFQSDQQLALELAVPYRHAGGEATLHVRYRVERRGIDEVAAMRAATPPRRYRGAMPEAPEARSFPDFAPVGTCLGATATAIALVATFAGTLPGLAAPDPTVPTVPLVAASAAVAAVPFAAGLAADGVMLALWISEGIEHFRYDVAVGTVEHWDRSRVAYERRMRELGLDVPADY